MQILWSQLLRSLEGGDPPYEILYKQTITKLQSIASKQIKSLCYQGHGQRRNAMSTLKDRIDTAIMLISDADNVYRTKFYIVKQKIKVVDDDPGTSMLLSEDSFYSRTTERDEEYELLFAARGKKINGKRIRTAVSTRRYLA